MLVTEIRGIAKGHLGEGSWHLKGLRKITVLFGKNGSGKSTILDALASDFVDVDPTAGRVTVDSGANQRRKIYFEKIVPERGGFNKPEGSYLNNSVDNPNWFSQTAKGNMQPNYRQIVAVKFQNYALKASTTRTYGSSYNNTQRITEYLNKLLPPKHEVFTQERDARFHVRRKGETVIIPPENLSSGEREILSLGIDILVTVFQAEADRKHLVLLLDEPDVHLHPDLQSRLFVMLQELVNGSRYLQVIISTHSPAFLSDSEDLGVIWVDETSDELRPRSVPGWSNPLLLTLGRGILSPILSNVKTLLVEGPDDYLVWQQAVRSSGGKLKLVVIDCGSKPEIDKYVSEINRLLTSLSDGGSAPSRVIALKDSDGRTTQFAHHQFVDVYWTRCHELEDLIFSDEVGNDAFRASSGIHDFLNEDIKSSFLRLVESLPPSDRSWQQQLGAEVGKIFHADELDSKAGQANSIVNYLGIDFLNAIKD